MGELEEKGADREGKEETWRYFSCLLFHVLSLKMTSRAFEKILLDLGQCTATSVPRLGCDVIGSMSFLCCVPPIKSNFHTVDGILFLTLTGLEACGAAKSAFCPQGVFEAHLRPAVEFTTGPLFPLF